MPIQAQHDPIIEDMARELKESNEPLENLRHEDGTPKREFVLACLTTYRHRGGLMQPEQAVSWPARRVLDILDPDFTPR